jgi:hypothetical protein
MGEARSDTITDYVPVDVAVEVNVNVKVNAPPRQTIASG